MIRDLHYPEEARKALDSLLHGLAYDAAVSVAGVALSRVPLPQGSPDFSVPVRCGGIEQDQAVRREAPSLFARFALISMVSRFEVHTQELLLQRKVLEHLRIPGSRMDGPSFWRILTQVQQDSRSGPVRMCDGLVVVHPSDALKQRMEWLEGLYRVRNCLAHRLGRVQMVDVKPPGTPLNQTKEEDRLRAVWLRVRVSAKEREVQLPYTPSGALGQVDKIDFVPEVREWKVGDMIVVDPLDCQSIAISFSMLGTQLQTDFEREMNALLLAAGNRGIAP